MPRLRFFVLVSLLLALAPARAAMNTSAERALLMDAATGQVLWAKDGFSPMPPASMSKLMTLELLFQRLKDGRVKLTDTFPVSERAWRTGGSKSFMKIGDNVPVEALIRSIIIPSGNDACIVVAEALGGTTEGFIDLMNRRAKALGMKNSHFVNPHGLPDPPGQMMSAYDLAVLARHLIDTYPAYYHYFSERQFTWTNITQSNHNKVLDKFPGADGLKTGHTDAAGYGITLSAKDAGGRRLILVLNGLDSEGARAQEGERLLTWGQRNFRDVALFRPGDAVAHDKVWLGTAPDVALTVPHAVSISVPVSGNAAKALRVTASYKTPLTAPVAAGTEVGTLSVALPSGATTDVPLVTATDIARKGAFGRVLPVCCHWLGL